MGYRHSRQRFESVVCHFRFSEAKLINNLLLESGDCIVYHRFISTKFQLNKPCHVTVTEELHEHFPEVCSILQASDKIVKVKIKVIPQQAEVTQAAQGRLKPRIFLTFGTTRVVGRQPYAPTAFTPGEIPGTHFQRLSRPQGTWFRREPRKKSRLVAQCLNHYANPGPAASVV